jgi:hypothetical protein
MVDWTTTTIKHGTTSGYTLHRKLGEKACRRCHKAKADSNAKSYARRTKGNNRQLQQARAQSFARSELVRRHKKEYDRLYKQYKLELGVA